MSSQPGPAPKQPKPRVLQDGRDMFWSLAPLVLACIVLAGLVGLCSFQPTGPKSGPAPKFDAAAALRADAEQLAFPVRLPQLPDGWHANSGRRGSIEDGRTDPATGQKLRAVTSTIGYLTPSGIYLSLTQSNADERPLVEYIDTASSLEEALYPTGTQDVVGAAGPATSGTVVRWVVYSDPKDKGPLWTTRLDGPNGPAQIAITGAASPDAFRTLAAATQSQQPLPATAGK